MSSMSKRYPIAIAISDLHLSLTQPICRADKDWMAIQAHYLDQVKETAQGLNPLKSVPILCAGDIFDRWNTPPELINFALTHLPDGMLCIPGQHDLPNHRINQLHRSGYGVLKETGKIVDVSELSHMIEGITIHGFGWGQKIQPLEINRDDDTLHIALIHQYCWTIDHSYSGAPEESHLSSFSKQLDRYDVAIFGDNHKGFLKKLKTGTVVLNVGGFIRRRSDEVAYEPSIGIIYNDGVVEQKRLDTSIDTFHKISKGKEEIPLNVKEFIQGLESLGEHGLNFKEAVENHLRSEEIDKEIKEIIIRCLIEPKA